MAQPFVGEIRMFAGNFPPVGWMFCSGQLISIAEYDTLYTLIGTTYGGDGQSTFRLPDLQSRVPIHYGKGITGSDHVLSEAGGVENVTLNTLQIPQHNHALLATTNLADTASPANAQFSTNAPGSKMYSSGTPTIPLNNNTITPTGGSQPHDNLQPYLCISFIISLYGVYPQPS